MIECLMEQIVLREMKSIAIEDELLCRHRAGRIMLLLVPLRHVVSWIANDIRASIVWIEMRIMCLHPIFLYVVIIGSIRIITEAKIRIHRIERVMLDRMMRIVWMRFDVAMVICVARIIMMIIEVMVHEPSCCRCATACLPQSALDASRIALLFHVKSEAFFSNC